MTNALNKSFNKTIIEGRVVRIPELRQTTSGISYCKLIVAVNELYYVAGHSQKNTSYIMVAVWNKTAEACCKYLIKGQKVRVIGRLRQSVWTNNNGLKRSQTEIVCETVEFLDKPRTKAAEVKPSTAAVAVDAWAATHDSSEYRENDWAEEMADADLQEI